MSPITTNDLFLIQRGPDNFKATAGEVATFTNLGAGVTSITVTTPITLAGTASVPTIGADLATEAAPGVAKIATLIEQNDGTSNSVISSPAYTVSKDGAGKTGAAIIPSGTAASTTAALPGKFRYYTDTRGWFGNDGTGWTPFDQRKVVVISSAYTAKANDYVVVSTAAQTVTLPSNPLAGVSVTVVVAGTFTDTVVARGGSNIMGLAENITLDKQYAAMQFTFTNTTNGWRLN